MIADRADFDFAVEVARTHALEAVGCALLFSPVADAVAPAGKSLSFLFLGGTGFIGPHQVEHALARGHRVTIFNRGRRSGTVGSRTHPHHPAEQPRHCASRRTA